MSKITPNLAAIPLVLSSARVTPGYNNINIASPGATIDGVTMVAGDKVLLPQQSTPTQNGMWIWNGASVPMTRNPAFAANGTYRSGQYVYTVEGSTWGKATWIPDVNGATNFVVGTDVVYYRYVSESSQDRSRNLHTGTQLATTISDFATAADNAINGSYGSLAGSNAWTGNNTFSNTVSLTGPTRSTSSISNAASVLTTSTTLGVGSSEWQLVSSNAGAVTITPYSTTNSGYRTTVVKTDTSTNAITLVGTFSGMVNPTLMTQWDRLTFISTSTAGVYIIVANDISKPFGLPTLANATTTTETVIARWSIPAGALTAGDVLNLQVYGQTSSTATLTYRVRMGTAGTTSDALLMQWTTSAAGVANGYVSTNMEVMFPTSTTGSAHGVIFMPTSVAGPLTGTYAPATVSLTVVNFIEVTVVQSAAQTYTTRMATLTPTS